MRPEERKEDEEKGLQESSWQGHKENPAQVGMGSWPLEIKYERKLQLILKIQVKF